MRWLSRPPPHPAADLATTVCAVPRVPSQRTAVAVAYCKRGKGSIKLNGCPI
eukprot:COSAG06_NODE_63415_length_262_cov_0.766871_1_plen_51_part_01